VLIGMSAIGMLGRLAPRRAVPVAAAPQARRVVLPSARATATPVPATVREWTPVPIPKPLYLQSSSSLPEPVEGRPSNLDIARAQLARAAAESEAALRAAQQQATPITASGRFAAMGRLDEADLASTDIDAVLARRRA
jgi:hypothetical protein